MEYYSMQFSQAGGAMGQRILSNPIYTYIYFALNRLSRCIQFKRDDIGIKVVVEVLPVNIEKVFVGAKDIIERLELVPLPLKNAGNKVLETRSIR